MLSILQKEFIAMHKNGGKPPTLSPEDKLYVTLKLERIPDNGQHCSGIRRMQRHDLPVYPRVEDILMKDGTFTLP